MVDKARVCMITNQGHFYTISKAAKADTTNLGVITVTQYYKISVRNKVIGLAQVYKHFLQPGDVIATDW